MDPRVTVFAPNPLLSVAIEVRGGADDLHFHAAGQGVWVARMAGELGAYPILCGMSGGETGVILKPLLEALPGELRIATTVGDSGSYVVDRRQLERRALAQMFSPPPSRHEVDDLLAATCAAALDSELLAVCNPFPAEALPEDAYDTIVANVHAAGVPVLVDLSSPRLDHVLQYEPDLVKLNDWELAEYVRGPVDGPRAVAAANRLRDAGARTVVVTRAAAPILVLTAGEEPFEIVPPAFPYGHREGCGDAMFGALAAAWARGAPLREALVLGAAAGSANFVRHGLGTGRAQAIEELARRVEVRALTTAPSAA